jgi:hypothetical protein
MHSWSASPMLRYRAAAVALVWACCWRRPDGRRWPVASPRSPWPSWLAASSAAAAQPVHVPPRRTTAALVQ